jgi:lipid-binding SYLF domain-containing protein
MKRKITLILASLLCLPVISIAEERSVLNQDPSMRARMKDIKEDQKFRTKIDEAFSVYEAITSNPQAPIPRNVLRDAKCIAVLPGVMTGAIIVGGTYGEGVASCKNADNAWSQPAAISLSKGSIGLQAGAKSADMVLFFVSQSAASALKRGNFALGSDVSAIAGNYEATLDTSSAGVVVYTQTEGMFAGASVSGSQIGIDKDELARYYNKKVDYTALLDGREFPDQSGYTEKLTKLFP